jgi:predicted DNA-binding transcriptional regulator YafY
MKLRNGQRVFSFSTKITNLPKLIGSSEQTPTDGQLFEFNWDSAEQEQKQSTWVANGQPSTFVIQNVKRSQQDLKAIFQLTGLDEYPGKDEATASLVSLQKLFDQVTPLP